MRKINRKNKKINKQSVAAERKGMENRLKVTTAVALLGVAIVSGSLARIIFFHGNEYSKAAYNQQVKNKIISPNRGTIFDANGEILAMSVAVSTVSINPGTVVYSNKKTVPNEVLIDAFCKYFSLTKDDAEKKVKSSSSVSVIARKVEKDKIDEFKKWMAEQNITSGINIDEDMKREYPYNDLASNLLGFCGTDNSGLAGLEDRWDSVLTGTAGKVVTANDVHGEAISDETEQYVAAENGSNLYLTIDTKIQKIAEKYIEQACIENNAKAGGNVVIMNPQNGDVLAMATYPDYNLNAPMEILPTGLQGSWDNYTAEEKNNALYSLWTNKAVSSMYEPGSTFKLITSAIGLEENLVKTDTAGDFFCDVVYKVADRDIKCWSKAAHKSQTLREALEHSCNPAFMQLGQRIGARTLYKYYDAFGFFEKIGADIAATYPGIFKELDKVGPVELATMSFGQRFTISPLQLVSAVSAICNDGVYVNPRIVKQIENTDTGNIETIETQRVRQVISKETSDKVKNMMESVVIDGTGKHAKVEGYSIGGKSGTSEPTENKTEDGYVASFIAISPIENTQVVCLVIVYGLTGKNYQGGQVAGPVAAQILSEVLPLMGVTSDGTEKNLEVENNVAVSNVTGKTVAEAKRILEQTGFNVRINCEGDENTTIVADQVPKSGISLTNGSIVCLYADDNDVRVSQSVPNVKGMSVEEATRVLRSLNLNIKVQGTVGNVVSQDPYSGTAVEEGSVIKVVIKEELTDTQ